jgi:hypothetical protein
LGLPWGVSRPGIVGIFVIVNKSTVYRQVQFPPEFHYVAFQDRNHRSRHAWRIADPSAGRSELGASVQGEGADDRLRLPGTGDEEWAM